MPRCPRILLFCSRTVPLSPYVNQICMFVCLFVFFLLFAKRWTSLSSGQYMTNFTRLHSHLSTGQHCAHRKMGNEMKEKKGKTEWKEHLRLHLENMSLSLYVYGYVYINIWSVEINNRVNSPSYSIWPDLTCGHNY